jgi:hypothetical protein
VPVVVGILLAIVAAVVITFGMILLIPFSLAMRYRTGTSRQMARGWLAGVNVVSIGISVVLLVGSAAVTTFWVPRALPYTLAGLLGGGVLGLLGLAATRWEVTPDTLHYTPNRLLVGTILLVVTARIGYGFWRAWNAWGEAGDTSWLAQAGVAGSMGAGAVVVGYYLAFWLGVRRRLRRHRGGPYRGPVRRMR